MIGGRSRFAVPTVACSLAVALLALSAGAALAAQPTITNVQIEQVGITSATITADVDTGGLPTTYEVQYGATEAYGSETTPTEISTGTRTVAVTLEDLTPATDYHFAFAARNAEGSTRSSDADFTTYASQSGLPDNRYNELVSASTDEHAEVYTPYPGLPGGTSIGPLATNRPFQASANGEAVAYEGDATTSGYGFDGEGFGNALVARRSGTGGWKVETVQPKANASLVTHTTTLQAFSPDLSQGIVSGCTDPGLTPVAPTPEVSNPFGIGYNLLYKRGQEGTYSPLFTERPRNRPTGWAGSAYFGTAAVGVFPGLGDGYNFLCEQSLVYAGSSSGFDDLLFEANDSVLEGSGVQEEQLAKTVKGEMEEERESNDLYVSSDSKSALVNILPEGAIAPNATFGAQVSIAGYPSGAFSHVISADGSKIFWTDLTTGVIYERDNGVSTIAISPGAAQYWTASVDGRYVLYTENGGLYRVDTNSHTPEALAGQSAETLGVVGASDDVQHVFFVADGVLGAGAVQGQPNLYEWSMGSVSFIATLSAADGTDIIRESYGSDWSPSLGLHTADVTPDGRTLVFTSTNNLTGYRNEGQPEVYVYESGEGGGLWCVSCDPTGSPGSTGQLQLSESNTYQTRSISTNGDYVFFNSPSALAPQDTDGVVDAYEWERDGVGSCKLANGCVYLLSGGTAGGQLIDASESGNDVFFATRAQLSPEDRNELVDLYDARVGGQPLAKLACSGTGCQGPPAPPPLFATPASVTYEGVGNFPSAPPVVASPGAGARRLTRAQERTRALKACKAMRNRRKRSRCEARVRRRFGPPAHKRSTRGNK